MMELITVDLDINLLVQSVDVIFSNLKIILIE